MPSRSYSYATGRELRIFSDFDNTIIPVNAGVKLARSYLWSGKGNVLARLHRVVRLRRILSATMFDRYYRLLRALPVDQRRRVLADIPVSARWLRAVQELRFAHKVRNVRLTIITRNSVDVVDDWLAVHQEELSRYGITVDMVIANKPIEDRHSEVVRQRFQHIDRAGIGELDVERKRRFLPDDAIYIGDYDEEILADGVKEFVRV